MASSCHGRTLISRGLNASYQRNLDVFQRAIPVSYHAKQYSIASHSNRPIQNLPQTRQVLSKAFHTSPQHLSSSKFTYGIAASFNAKGTPYSPKQHIFNFNPYNRITARRKDKKTRPASGEDAFFVSRVDQTSDVAFGVADGVGGWSDSGVDPADFSHGICDYMAHAAYTHEVSGTTSAQTLMQTGYEKILQDPTLRAGGSTACVAIAKGNGTLDVSNLGDSGFMQIRLNAIHTYSKPQTHAFNTPYQLSRIPLEDLKKARRFGGMRFQDMPWDAQAYESDLRHGDVLVFASDGVWDNLSRQEVLRVVSRIMFDTKAWKNAQEGVETRGNFASFTDPEDGETDSEKTPSLQSLLAIGITREARAASMNTKRAGPFAMEVKRYFPGEPWEGGKVDDICVLVAIAVDENR